MPVPLRTRSIGILPEGAVRLFFFWFFLLRSRMGCMVSIANTLPLKHGRTWVLVHGLCATYQCTESRFPDLLCSSVSPWIRNWVRDGDKFSTLVCKDLRNAANEVSHERKSQKIERSHPVIGMIPSTGDGDGGGEPRRLPVACPGRVPAPKTMERLEVAVYIVSSTLFPIIHRKIKERKLKKSVFSRSFVDLAPEIS